MPVQVMMTPQEKAEAQRLAQTCGTTLSELVRIGLTTTSPTTVEQYRATAGAATKT